MRGKEFLKRFRPGIILALLGCLAYSIATTTAASIIKSVGSSTIVGFRYSLQSVVVSSFLYKEPEKKFNLTRKELLIVLLSGLSLGITSFGSYWSTEFIPVVDSTAIRRSQVVVVFVISGIWLKEKIGIYEIFMVIFVIVGVFVTSQPTFIFSPRNSEDYNGLSLSWFGYFLATLTSVAGGVTTSFIKRVHSVGPVTIISFQGIVILSMFLIFNQILNDGNDPQDSYEWLYLLLVSVAAGTGRILLTWSLMYEDAFLISVLNTSEIAFTLILEILFLNRIPNWISIVGALLIVSGVICLQLKSRILKIFAKKTTSEEEKNLI